MNRNISVIIPTLQKSVETLNNLVEELVTDESVKEILIIDNSLKGYKFNSEKVRVIIPKENLFVNPSWNLGVKEAKYEYICIANDDIKIGNNFCTKVVEKISDEHGIIGMNKKFVIDTRDENGIPLIDINNAEIENSKKLELAPTKVRPYNFGIIMFIKKENYIEIPNDLKIFFGDDWLFFQLQKQNKINAICEGQKVYHLGSLSSKEYLKTKIKKEEKIYFNYILKFKRFFDFYEDEMFKYFFILGIKIRKRKK